VVSGSVEEGGDRIEQVLDLGDVASDPGVLGCAPSWKRPRARGARESSAC
jgi:hypothetical protein